MALKIAIIYGSVRSERQGIKAALFIMDQLEKRGHQAVLIDPAQYDLPLIDKLYNDYAAGEAPTALQEIAGILLEADAFIIVSGEYNHTIPPALTNLIDHFNQEYRWRPAGIASYSNGPFGGVRAVGHLRDHLSHVGMATIPTSFPISKVQEAFDEQGNAIDTAYERRIQRFLNELEWYANALKEARKAGVPYE